MNLILHTMLKSLKISEDDPRTLLCLIVGGGHFATFEIFHPP